MKKNGAEVVHLATGLIVGYPPCPYIEQFCNFITEKYAMRVVIGTHPIPENYYLTHQKLGTWHSPEWDERLKLTLANQKIRLAYD